ncbi:MAG: GNAT family N-acetyltransferase [Candidatus Sedimenticola sp. (ex Thyasira tokunagai)]
MRVEVCSTIDDLPAEQWDRLVKGNNPFLRHAFLAALEHNNCASPTFGWRPMHLAAWEGERLVAAMPLYLKDNSYGEFVFDHAWAQAYQRHSLSYYPKLVSSIPYAPATGQRMLLADELPAAELSRALLDKAIEVAAEVEASSLHWLFIDEEESRLHHSMGLMLRNDVQFHWHNRDYADFDAFLAELNAKRRKNIRRERRLVAESGLRLQLYHGDEVDDATWELFARMYEMTFEQRYSLPTLNSGFFKEVAKEMGQQVILVLAYDGDEAVAGAWMLRSDDTLYGRHWGCLKEVDNLHFETCFYQGIEYCIANGLKHFEPGAQGEHKIWRGFLPTRTYSSHWISHPEFAEAIADFLRREQTAIDDYKAQLEAGSPYRKG